MDTTVTIALISFGIPAILAGIFTPIIVAVVQAKNKRQEAELANETKQLEAKIAAATRQAEREEEYKRADVLEARAAKRAEDTAAMLIKATLDVRDLVVTVDRKADEIHVLSNSAYTASLQATLEAVQATLAALLGSASFKRANNMVVEPEALAEIMEIKKKMATLSAVINERLRQDALAKEEKAKAILLGAQQRTINTDQPLPVADDRVAVATERMADAAERTADTAAKAVKP